MRRDIFWKIALPISALFALLQSCAPTPSYYSQVVPATFFDSQDKVYQRMGRPFTHWSWYVADQQMQSTGLKLNEYTTDEMLIPARYNDWYDAGKYIRLYQHDFIASETEIFSVWENFSRGYAEAISAKDDIDMYADFKALGFKEGEREAILMQLQTLMAYFALSGLDHFGGIPLYGSNFEEPKARSTDLETFNYIEKLLKEAIVALPKKTTLGKAETGNINMAAGAGLLMRLYFNAEAYIKTAKYKEAATIAQEIIDGVYGAYDLDDDWRDIFGFGNETSPEIIWTCASEAVSTRGVGVHSYHYMFNQYWGNSTPPHRNNGFCLVPSLDKDGKSYLWGSTNASPNGTYRLGSPFAKFHEKDLRKRLHGFDPATKTFTGMFYFGELKNPYTGAICHGAGGNRQIPTTRILNLKDQIARMTPWSLANEPLNHGREGIRWAEEDSGVRLAKFSPIPDLANNNLLGISDIPVMRMAEVYYTLAECKMRAGDKADAAKLINAVRARYFEGEDPDPVTAANLDQWRMLDEWLMEFISEGRRRTDLVRWGKFVTESWWDHQATNQPHKNRFPIPNRAMNGNKLLVQNPGYN